MSGRRRIKPLSLEQLDNWLRDDAGLRWKNIGVSELDGFLTALVVGPRFIHPDKWLKVIFGAAVPGQRGEPKGEKALQAIIERYNTISTTLAERPLEFGPIFIREPDGRVLPQYWADGFWQAMQLNLPKWAPIMTPDKWTILLPIMIYNLDRLGLDKGPQQIPPAVVKHLSKDGYHHIPEALAIIRDFFMESRSASL